MSNTIKDAVKGLVYWPLKWLYEAAKMTLGTIGSGVFRLIAGVFVYGAMAVATGLSLALVYFLGDKIAQKLFGTDATQAKNKFLGAISEFPYIQESLRITAIVTITKLVPEDFGKTYTDWAKDVLKDIFKKGPVAWFTGFFKGNQSAKAKATQQDDVDEEILVAEEKTSPEAATTNQKIDQILAAVKEAKAEVVAARADIAATNAKASAPKVGGIDMAGAYGYWLGEQFVEVPVNAAYSAGNRLVSWLHSTDAASSAPATPVVEESSPRDRSASNDSATPSTSKWCPRLSS